MVLFINYKQQRNKIIIIIKIITFYLFFNITLYHCHSKQVVAKEDNDIERITDYLIDFKKKNCDIVKDLINSSDFGINDEDIKSLKILIIPKLYIDEKFIKCSDVKLNYKVTSITIDSLKVISTYKYDIQSPNAKNSILSSILTSDNFDLNYNAEVYLYYDSTIKYYLYYDIQDYPATNMLDSF